MAGNDRLFLGGNHDTGYGGTGNDQLFGEAGNDTLRGEAGNDLLRGGLGVDQLYGGGDADRFIFAQVSESTPGARDVIRDFHRAEADKIDLGLIDARSGTATNDAFSYIGNAAFTGVKGQLQWLDSGADILVRADVNGDKVADFAVLVTNVTRLQLSDFVL
jgi:serralysin